MLTSLEAEAESELPATIPESDSQSNAAEEPPVVNFAFVHSVLLPDGTPDVHFRTARGGQKLRDIMLDSNIDLYGPYARPLLNCGGGGTCATCLVEVIQGKELLNPRTDQEKEKLKSKQKIGDWLAKPLLAHRTLQGWMSSSNCLNGNTKKHQLQSCLNEKFVYYLLSERLFEILQ